MRDYLYEDVVVRDVVSVRKYGLQLGDVSHTPVRHITLGQPVLNWESTQLIIVLSKDPRGWFTGGGSLQEIREKLDTEPVGTICFYLSLEDRESDFQGIVTLVFCVGVLGGDILEPGGDLICSNDGSVVAGLVGEVTEVTGLSLFELGEGVKEDSVTVGRDIVDVPCRLVLDVHVIVSRAPLVAVTRRKVYLALFEIVKHISVSLLRFELVVLHEPVIV